MAELKPDGEKRLSQPDSPNSKDRLRDRVTYLFVYAFLLAVIIVLVIASLQAQWSYAMMALAMLSAMTATCVAAQFGEGKKSTSLHETIRVIITTWLLRKHQGGGTS